MASPSAEQGISAALRARFAERVFGFVTLIHGLENLDLDRRLYPGSLSLRDHLAQLCAVYRQFIDSYGEGQRSEAEGHADPLVAVQALRAHTAICLARGGSEPLDPAESLLIVHDDFHLAQIELLRADAGQAETKAAVSFSGVH